LRAAGLAPGFPDIAIVATAVYHGLTILTRSRRYCEPMYVAVIDPFQDARK
jgi:toxin FitB